MAREKRKLRDFGNLWPAEALILAGLDDPHTTMVGDGERPDADAPQDRRVRASFLRWCALGGGKDHRLHETGLRIAGALVVGDGEADPFQGDTATPGLDLEGCEVPGDLAFMNCRFEHPPVLRAARLRNLFLNGSALPGLQADRLATTGNVSLRNAKTEGEVRLSGASIGGSLNCEGGMFSNESGSALHADRLSTKGTVFLRNAKTEGGVRLPGASIGGDLSCAGGTFRNEGGAALSANRAKVTGALFWRDGARAEGWLDLTAAQIGVINDAPADWPERGDLLLNRCEYGAFTGFGISGEERIDWLSRQSPADFDQDFWPQPWEQCAKVLREMGHAEDARAVLIDKERRQRADRRKKLVGWRKYAYRLADWGFDQTVRYGHRPLRACGGLVILLFLTMAVFFAAWRLDAMKPNNAFVLRADEWVRCAPHATKSASLYDEAYGSQLDCFLAQPEGQSFPEFNAAIYAADVLFPLVEIEQQANWTPHEDKPFGLFAKWTMYLSIILGWALSLLAVAGFSGLVKSD